MTIQDFATRYRLHTRLDDDQTTIVPGKYGHIFDYDDDSLGVLIMPKKPRLYYWGFRRTAFLQAGFTVTQNGDHEGAATFDPQNPAHAKLAIRSAGIKVKKTLSESDRALRSNRMRELNRIKWSS